VRRSGTVSLREGSLSRCKGTPPSQHGRANTRRKTALFARDLAHHVFTSGACQTGEKGISEQVSGYRS
jgi:hypothetical protein